MFEVTTWRNRNNINACYGIRIKHIDYLSLENWEGIKVNEAYIERKNARFTPECPEIRNKIIKNFIFENNLHDWLPRQPHTLFLFEYEEKKFELLLENA